MAKQSDFNSFLSDIEPSPSAAKQISSAHNALRDFLSNHETYGNLVERTYLSGSYAKHTAIRNSKDSEKNDVDIIVEIKGSRDNLPSSVLADLKAALLDKAVYSSARVQSHSVGVELSSIKMDIVPLITESSKKYIGDKSSESWDETNPEKHKEWSTNVNSDSNQKYKPLVKILKWWRKEHCPEGAKYPKGITLEKLIADNLPDFELGTEDYLIQTMDNLVQAIEDMVSEGAEPFVEDPAILGKNMAAEYTRADFTEFADKLQSHLEIIAEEGKGNSTWQQVLGNRFPADSGANERSFEYATKSGGSKSIVPHAPHRKKPIWPMVAKGPSITITMEVRHPSGEITNEYSNQAPLEKGCDLTFRALVSSRLKQGSLYWQIVNTGSEAEADGGLRGGFELGEIGSPLHYESTLYCGTHFIVCYLVRNGRCVAFSKEFLVNIQ